MSAAWSFVIFPAAAAASIFFVASAVSAWTSPSTDLFLSLAIWASVLPPESAWRSCACVIPR